MTNLIVSHVRMSRTQCRVGACQVMQCGAGPQPNVGASGAGPGPNAVRPYKSPEVVAWAAAFIACQRVETNGAWRSFLFRDEGGRPFITELATIPVANVAQAGGIRLPVERMFDRIASQKLAEGDGVGVSQLSIL